MAKKTWKYKRLHEWDNPHFRGGNEKAADIGVYEAGKLIATVSLMGVDKMDDKTLKAKIRRRAIIEVAATKAREEAELNPEPPRVPDEMSDSFDPEKAAEPHP